MTTQLSVQTRQDVTIVGFEDAVNLDAYQVALISGGLYDLIDNQAKRRIVLDFSSVQFVSSASLGVLIKMRSKADHVDGKIVLCGVRDNLRKVFKITNLDALFEFTEDVESAVKAVSRS